MKKQEEIREIIDAYTDDTCLYPDKTCELRGSDIVGGYCVSDDGSYNCLMERLDKIGVVIKVGEDEVEIVDSFGAPYKTKIVATEPLI